MAGIRIYDNGLIVEHKKSTIIFESVEGKKEGEEKFVFPFSEGHFHSFADYIESVANECWKDIVPKEASSEASDYYEYYDKKYDNNGYLDISTNQITIIAPLNSIDTLYKFNKSKIQSFIYDLKKYRR